VTSATIYFPRVAGYFKVLAVDSGTGGQLRTSFRWIPKNFFCGPSYRRQRGYRQPILTHWSRAVRVRGPDARGKRSIAIHRMRSQRLLCLLSRATQTGKIMRYILVWDQEFTLMRGGGATIRAALDPKGARPRSFPAPSQDKVVGAIHSFKEVW